MAVRDANTPTQCQVACSHQPECRAFTLIVGGSSTRRRRCWLKKAGYVRMASTGTAPQGGRKCASVAQSELLAYCRMEQNCGPFTCHAWIYSEYSSPPHRRN
eukprot:7301839-Prymnesium_polylepis.1